MIKSRFLGFVLTLLLIYPFKAEASSVFTPGRSCAPIPVINDPGDNFLQSYSVYGHLLNNLDMSYYSSACDPNSTTFDFCLASAAGKPGPCVKISMGLSDSKKISELSQDTLVATQDMVKDIELKISQVNDLFCLTMHTSRGQTPLVCRKNILSELAGSPFLSAPQTTPNCTSPVSEACYGKAVNSLNIISLSGLSVICLKDSLNNIFYRNDLCSDSVSESTPIRFFADFQNLMRRIVSVAVILYAIFFGLNTVLEAKAELNDWAIFVFKIIAVFYFSIGLGNPFVSGGTEMVHNGIVEYVLPFLSGAISEFADMAFSAGGSAGLCVFDQSKYADGYGFLKLWDAIDCRLLYYFGLKELYNMGDLYGDIFPISVQSGNFGPAIQAASSTSDAPSMLDLPGSLLFFVITFFLLLSGNIIAFLCCIIFAVILIATLMQFVSLYLVCAITLYAMAYLAPIFVPMLLFEHTKGYFDAWVKIMLSVTLQPMVCAGFLAVGLTFFDSALYGDCMFQRYDYDLGGGKLFSSFRMTLPPGSPDKCTASAGYNLFQYYMGSGWSSIDLLLFDVKVLSWDWNLILSLVQVSLFCLIYYHFSAHVTDFAAEITGGPIMSSVTINPKDVVKGMYGAAKKAFSSKGNEKPPEEKKEEGKDEGAKDFSGDGALRGGAKDLVGGGK